MKKHIVLITGYPGAGKSSLVGIYTDKGYVNFNRVLAKSSSEDLHEKVDKHLKDGKTPLIVLDNTYPTIDSRAGIIKIAQKHKIPITCVWLKTSIEQAQVNATRRIIQKHGYLLSPKEILDAKSPNIFPPVVLFTYKKQFQKPTTKEGFEYVVDQEFTPNPLGKEYKNKALILDYDGTLRETISGNKFPVDPSDVRILPGRKEVLKKYKDAGYLLLGVSNQSGIAKKQLTEEAAKACFKKTNDLLGFDIEVRYCSHSVPPITCFCRKPMPGLGVEFIEKYKLDPKQCIMVGDMTSDKTFAERAGFKFMDQAEFFALKSVAV